MGCVGVDRSVGAMTKYRVTRFVTGCSRRRILHEMARRTLPSPRVLSWGANPPPYCDMPFIVPGSREARFAADYVTRRREYDEEFSVPHGDSRPEITSSPGRERINVLPAFTCQEWEQMYGLCSLQGTENHRDAWGSRTADADPLP